MVDIQQVCDHMLLMMQALYGVTNGLHPVWITVLVASILFLLIRGMTELTTRTIRAHTTGRQQLLRHKDMMESQYDTQTNRRRDIFHISFLIRQKLIADLVPAILEYAEFFDRQVSRTDRKDPLMVTEQDGPAIAHISRPIKVLVRLQHPVRKVAFVIKSHDQGWANDPAGGSWTWLTAGVAREEQLPHEQSTTASLRKDSDPPPQSLKRERVILRNKVASRECNPRVQEWRSDSSDKEERDWVNKLENGDIIVVRAWAQYGGWVNFVRGVAVVTYSVAVVR